MLLAGGVGSRLNILASRRAKPAVPFGAAYRIIDFTLSNVMHAGLERVGLLTQYKPFSLMEHVGAGEPWDLVGRERGVKILPPYTGEVESDWYKGTADAVWQNLWFMEDHRPDKVLILSGDHIYRMDYEAMISAHERAGAALTIAAMPVPWDETHRFGVMEVDGDGWITGFQEKVRGARSNLASMGIYVFSYEVLAERLRSIVGSRAGFDFGKDVIPSMLGRHPMLGFPFAGYWRDVGTIDSYLAANLDCLDPASGLDLEAWGVTTRPTARGRGDRPPVRLGADARVNNCLIARGSVIEGEVANSVVFPGAHVGRDAVVRDSVVMHDAVLEDGCRVERSILDKEAVVGRWACVGVGDPAVANRAWPSHLACGITVIGKQARVSAGLQIGTNCIVNPGVTAGADGTGSIGDGETVTA
jgi:glucose-1-phosphate adenylyltransferase